MKSIRSFRPAALTLALLLALCQPVLAQTVSVTRGPYLQTGTPTSIIMKWRTSAQTDSCVRYGTSISSLTGQSCVTTLTTEHLVKLGSLLPNTQYYYSIGTSAGSIAGEGDSTYFFLTAPLTGTAKATRIWVLGDAGTNNSSQRAVRDAYLTFTGSRHTDLWLMLGDNAYSDGTDSEHQVAVFDMYPTVLRKSVLWPTFGNHEAHTASSSSQSGPYYDIFTLPKSGEAGGLASGTEAYYSFNYGNIHFVCLDSSDSDRSPSGAMLTWLKADLATNTQQWLIAYWHHPPYSKGVDSDTNSTLAQMRQYANPILEDYGVDLVLSGHSHSYERSYLLNGHYGVSSTLTSAMIVDAGDGRADGTGAYQKPIVLTPHKGTVYTVAGSSGMTGGGSLNHPAMYISLNVLGSLVLDINGSRLDAQFLTSSRSVPDHFTILKGSSGTVSPTITSFTPTSGPGGTTVTITGTNFTGATQVAFNGTTASLNGSADTQINTSVPGGATSGKIRVTTLVGSVDSASAFTVTGLPPTISSFTPTSGPGGTAVTITGSNFTGATQVTFNSVAAALSVVSNTQINTSVPGGATTGKIRVTTPAGLADSASAFTVTGLPTSTSVEVRVSASADDAEEQSSGTVSLTSSDLELVYDGNNQTVGMRFTGVNIPRGATIVNAYVQFQVDETNSEPTALTIKGQAIDTALTFTTATKNVTARTRTAAAVAWSPPAWTTVGAAGPDQQTPSLTSVVQEIVSRPGWSSGNSLVVIINGTGHRTAKSYDGSKAGAPLLHVEYK